MVTVLIQPALARLMIRPLARRKAENGAFTWETRALPAVIATAFREVALYMTKPLVHLNPELGAPVPAAPWVGARPRELLAQALRQQHLLHLFILPH